MLRPKQRLQSNKQELGILPSYSTYGMWGSRKTSCDGLSNNKKISAVLWWYVSPTLMIPVRIYATHKNDLITNQTCSTSDKKTKNV